MFSSQSEARSSPGKRGRRVNELHNLRRTE